MDDKVVTAAVLLIGDELLSGRTQDVNLKAIAEFLEPLGVQVREVRIVPDVQEAIIAALNALRAQYTYVFTTGGIGPTHDDITADAVAAAFGVSLLEREDMLAILRERYGATPDALNAARRRMARAPAEARLILNPVSGAPGFQIENVFVMAGVPGIMRGMLEDIRPRLKGGAVIKSRSVKGVGVKEGDIGAPLAALQEALYNVSLGSYPFFRGQNDFGVVLVARSADEALLTATAEALAAIIAAAGGEAEIEPKG